MGARRFIVNPVIFAGKLTSHEGILPGMKLIYPSITTFQQHVELKDYREPTKKEYVRYVRKLAEHFQCDPATLSENQIREYFLFLRQHKHYKRTPMKAAKYALISFFVEHLKVKDWTVFKEVFRPHPGGVTDLSRSRVGGADGLKGTRPKTVTLRPSSNRTGGFPASGFPRVIHSHRFYVRACVHAARVGSRYRP